MVYFVSFWVYLPDFPDDYVSPHPLNVPVNGSTPLEITIHGPNFQAIDGTIYRIEDGEISYEDWRFYELRIENASEIIFTGKQGESCQENRQPHLGTLPAIEETSFL